MTSVTVSNLTHGYSGGVTALDNVSLHADEGAFLVLVGPSGCGKTTLLRSIAGLEAVSAGEIRIGGRVVNAVSPKERDVAMVFQDYALYPSMSVRRNLDFGLRVRHVAAQERGRRVAEVARMLGLDELLDRKPSALSGGQRQRVALGRAMVREPSVLLMDEPLSNLDANTRTATRAHLMRVHQAVGTTTIYVTHDQVEAMTLGTHVAVMNAGRLQQFGPPETIFHAPANLFVARFMGSPPMNTCEVELDGDVIALGQARIALRDTMVRSVPAGAQARVVLGIRPGDLSIASGQQPGTSAITITPTVIERLGDGIHCHFHLHTGAGIVSHDPESAASDVAQATSWVAWMPATAQVRVGQPVTLGFTVEDLYLFDAVTGGALHIPERRRQLAADPSAHHRRPESPAMSASADGADPSASPTSADPR